MTAKTPMAAIVDCRDAWGQQNDVLLMSATYTVVEGKVVYTF